MATIDLYTKIGNTLLSGRNIQSISFNKIISSEGEEHERIEVIYLCGEVRVVYNDTPTPADVRNSILQSIVAIQQLGCYPQADSSCELGFIKLGS